MGHGAPRELAGQDGPKKDLDPEDSKRLEAAFRAYESKDPAFKTSREDEKHQQISKGWVNKCNEIVDDLRGIGKAMVNQHQVLIDCGQEGAGHGATPWVEEAGYKFDRLHFRLKGAKVVAECGMKTMAEIDDYTEIDYVWLEKAVVEWLVYEASNK